MEDEAVIRAQIAVILEDEGFRVSQAGDAVQA
jgi:DNA-binding response OmpR family regulator